jgi:LysR family transcriptional regulator, nod-box dependent transcriptional activator
VLFERCVAVHLKGLDLNLLVVLDALLAEKSTTRAGQRVFLSQPATSGALSRLRDYFGDQILIPSGQKMVLTPFAETLVEPVREILATTEKLISKTARFDPANSTRSFILNMSDVSATIFLANSIKRIREVAPRIHLEIVTHHNVPDVIEQGEVDFMEIPDFLASPLHPSAHLFDDENVCIASSRNKFIRKSLSLDQFLSLGHVTTRMQKRKDHLGDQMFQNTGVKPRFELIVPVFGLVPQAVVETDWIAVVNSRLARHYARYLPLKIFPLPMKIEPLKMLLQWNRYRDRDEGTQWMCGILVETLGSES